MSSSSSHVPLLADSLENVSYGVGVSKIVRVASAIRIPQPTNYALDNALGIHVGLRDQRDGQIEQHDRIDGVPVWQWAVVNRHRRRLPLDNASYHKLVTGSKTKSSRGYQASS
jgi:hypothetical protein